MARKQRPAAKSQVKSGPITATEIQAAALELFSERTFPVIGMRDIATSVGLLPGSLYAHISSKEQILYDIVRSGIANYLEALKPFAESTDPAPERMRGAIKAHLAVLSSTLQQTRVAFHQWQFLGDEFKEDIVGMRNQYEEVFATIYRDGVAEGTFRPGRSERIAVLAIIGMLTSSSEWYSPQGPLGVDEFGEALADSALEGLRERS